MFNILKRINFENIFKLLYYIAVVLCIYSFFFNKLNVTYNSIIALIEIRQIRIYILVLLILKLLYDIFHHNLSKLELILFLVSLPLILYTAVCIYDYDVEYNAHFLMVTLIPLLIVSSVNINYNSLFKCIALSYVVLFIIVFFMFLNNNTALDIVIRNNSTRLNIGFNWPTEPAHLFLCISMYYIYIRKKQISYIELFIMFFANLFLFFLTNTRSAFFYTNFILLIAIILKKYSHKLKYNNSVKAILIAIAFSLPVLSVFACMFYSEENVFVQSLNNILSNRLSLGFNAINTEKIHLFANYIEFVGGRVTEKYNMVDMGFLNFLLLYGAIPFILYLIYIIFFAISVNNRKDFYL